MRKHMFAGANKSFWLGVFMLVSCFASILAPARADGAGVRIQLCMVIDGSGTINTIEWNLTIQAIAKGIREAIPHDGSIELTIVQFGYSSGINARIEIQPTIVTDANYAELATNVTRMTHGNGGTPMAHGLYLAWNTIKSSSNFQTAEKQIINLATDGEPNVRNNNATSDLDGSGSINYYDDVIAVVNSTVIEGLDELDMEGIGISNANKEWFRNWVVRPQPGVVAPPFAKPGWIRFVADVSEFADTLGQKLHAIIGGKDIWTPDAIGAFLTSIITVGLTSIVSSLSSAVTNPETFPSQLIAQKVNAMLPDSLKKWLGEFISSKRKVVINPHTGPPFSVTKLEAVSYAISLSILTLAFAYVKASALDQILTIIPTVLVTSIIVEFVKNYIIAVTARTQGVWTEHRLWYFGLTLFLFSSIVLKVPFSSPSRLTHNSPKFTRRSLGLVAAAQVIIPIAFAAAFYALFTSGFTLIGNIGIVMCLTMAFFDSIPIPPMNGKDIYDWSKILWITLFIATFTLYMLVLFVL